MDQTKNPDKQIGREREREREREGVRERERMSEREEVRVKKKIIQGFFDRKVFSKLLIFCNNFRNKKCFV